MATEESDTSLESMLRRIPLREPGNALDARVDATFAKYRFRQPYRVVLFRYAVAAGVLIALGIGVRLATMTKTAAPMMTVATTANPIEIERDTSTVYDDGIIAGANDAAYQQYRRRTVREIWYINPRTHARSLITIPTEQVLIEKVEAF